ncbi:ADM-like [Rhinatrema bivittatum]|uniref:ADM-like n=1 Tax=Rhinatrema bivittatum TaxID=194408 RepID=UPI0011278562|nr:ADM-like [Rhinatrema bivittatum]XP_029441332.1 ADM-like [Rhinatrema bivittatum]
MTPTQLLPVLFCVLTTALCNSPREKDKDRPLPPSTVSFLERLKSLRSPSALQEAGSLPYVRPEEVQERSGAPARPLPRRREKRHVAPGIAMRGCHLGTCQLQNLASTLYRLGNNTGKNGSNRNTKDPRGYGRRRRSLARKKQHSPARRIAVAQRRLAT